MLSGPDDRGHWPHAWLRRWLVACALGGALGACGACTTGAPGGPSAGQPAGSPTLKGTRALDEVRRALGGKALSPCMGANLDLGAGQAACACVLPANGGSEAGVSCGEALAGRDLRGAVDVAVAAAPKLSGGEISKLELRFTNRTRGRVPLVYRLERSASLGLPFTVRDARGDVVDAGGECDPGRSANPRESVVVLEPGGSATLHSSLPASREMYRYRTTAGGEARCERSHAEPLPLGPYELEFFLAVPGLSAERPRLRFEVTTAH